LDYISKLFLEIRKTNQKLLSRVRTWKYWKQLVMCFSLNCKNIKYLPNGVNKREFPNTGSCLGPGISFRLLLLIAVAKVLQHLFKRCDNVHWKAPRFIFNDWILQL
jgi:hypothetical protein